MKCSIFCAILAPSMIVLVFARPSRAHLPVCLGRQLGDVAVAFCAQPECRITLFKLFQCPKRRGTRRLRNYPITEPGYQPGVRSADHHRSTLAQILYDGRGSTRASLTSPAMKTHHTDDHGPALATSEEEPRAISPTGFSTRCVECQTAMCVSRSSANPHLRIESSIICDG